MRQRDENGVFLPAEISDETKNAIIALYDDGDGLGARTIAKKLSLPRGVVKGFLKREGVYAPCEHIRVDISLELRAQICDLFADGLGASSISERLGVDIRMVQSALRLERKSQEKHRLFSKIPREQRAKIVADYQSGMSLNKMTKKYNFASYTMKRILLSEGVEIKDKSSYLITRFFTEAEELEIVRLYDSGEGSQRLCKRFKTHKKRLFSIIRKHGSKIRKMHSCSLIIHPHGSKNAIAVKYLDMHFRSLLEFSFYWDHIKPFGHTFVSGEIKELRIPYTNSLGKARMYRADFLINGNILVECKPMRRMNEPDVILKAEAARLFCKERDWEYKMIDCPINFEAIFEQYTFGNLFPISEERFTKYIRTHVNRNRKKSGRRDFIPFSFLRGEHGEKLVA